MACWGANGAGQLGDGTTVDRWEPVAATAFPQVTLIAAGASSSCAVSSDTVLSCVGDLSMLAWAPAPGVTLRHLSVGLGHAVLVSSAGALLTFGDNSVGQLGDGTTTDPASPVAVTLP